ncbi:hypothetical protein [Fulvimarina sp. MAC3]|uniref:hypothetical protein n=1 Tax=Fulvimarina sp. MAC3 TaxID=3148887 RepID=UPI0031FD73AC
MIAVSTVAAAAILVFAWRWLAGSTEALAPFFASRAAFWSTIGIFVGTVGMALVLVALSWRHRRQEREVIDFASRRIDAARHDRTKFSAEASDLSRSGLLGDEDAKIRERSRTSAAHVLALLFNDARFFRYQPVHLAVRAEEARLRGYSRSISAVQVFAIRAGILGTFVGLIWSLGQVQEVFLLRGTESASQGQPGLADELAALKDEIGVLVGDVVQGLALAFGTSIAGILAAIVIALLAAFVRWRETLLAAHIEKTGQKSQLFFREAFRGNEELIRTAEELRGAIKDNLDEVKDARSHLHQHAERLSNTAGEIGAGLADPVRLLAEQSAEIRAMLDHGREAARQVGGIAEKMQSIETMSSERLAKLSDHMDTLLRSQSDLLRAAIDENRAVTAKGLQEVSSSLTTGLGSAGRDLAEGLGPKLEDGLREGVSEALAGMTRQMQDALKDGLRQVEAERRRAQRSGLVLHAAALSTLTLAGILAIYFSAGQSPTAAATTAATQTGARLSVGEGRFDGR